MHLTLQSIMLIAHESGNIMWSLWLLDILHSLHFNETVITFTSRELETVFTTSELMFQSAYRALMNGETVQQREGSSGSGTEGALLLLIAILSDLIYLRGSLEGAMPVDRTIRHADSQTNPFISFSATSEANRMEQKLVLALSTWRSQYYEHMPPATRAFYHYCSVYRSCRRLSRLTTIAEAITEEQQVDHAERVAQEAVHAAWSVLDNVSKWSQERPLESVCPVWFPITLYHAAVVVWAQHRFTSKEQGERVHSSARMLIPFKIELGLMHWPGCKQMVNTLDRLIAVP